MSKITTTLNVNISLELTEGEAEALAAICGYGPEEFKKWFYRNLGKTYLQPFEKHLDSLFAKASDLDHAIKKVKDIRKQLNIINT